MNYILKLNQQKKIKNLKYKGEKCLKNFFTHFYFF